MNFRSVEDMADAIRRNLHRVPLEIDIVVGIPRSGLLPATMIALHRNIMMTDPLGLIEGRALQPGLRREKPGLKVDPTLWKNVLIVDDSVGSGKTIAETLSRISEGGQWNIMSCAIFGSEASAGRVDLTFDICESPRVFEWNFLHHPILTNSCVDFDGVLCVDPTEQENDDGENYRRFLREATPLYVPTVPVGTIVSARLERYRPEVEGWLNRYGIQYQALHLLDLPSAEERSRLRPHIPHKVSVYRSNPDFQLFIESDRVQALRIAEATGKAVICVGTMEIFSEGIRGRLERKIQRMSRGGASRLERIARRIVSSARK